MRGLSGPVDRRVECGPRSGFTPDRPDKIVEGESDETIKTFLVDRYGVFVLMRPPMRSDTYLLWFGPALLLLIGGGMVWAIVGRAKRRGASAGAELASEEFDETAPDQHA